MIELIIEELERELDLLGNHLDLVEGYKIDYIKLPKNVTFVGFGSYNKHCTGFDLVCSACAKLMIESWNKGINWKNFASRICRGWVTNCVSCETPFKVNIKSPAIFMSQKEIEFLELHYNKEDRKHNQRLRKLLAVLKVRFNRLKEMETERFLLRVAKIVIPDAPWDLMI